MTSIDSPKSSSAVSSRPISQTSTPRTERDVLFEDQSLFLDDEQYILVTGGLGFIGSHTSLELLKAGYNVIIVDNLSNSFRDVFDRILMVANHHFNSISGHCPQAKLSDIDYRDMSAMRALIESHSSAWLLAKSRRSNIIGVIHFAAFKAVEESIKQPLKYYSNNINGLVDFLHLLDEWNIKKFIFSSSATVYGTLANRGLLLREEHCVHEEQEYRDENGTLIHAAQGCTGLTNPHGRTKFFGEAILADLAASDPSWTITALRYFNPIGCDASGLLGEDPKGVPSNLVPALAVSSSHLIVVADEIIAELR
jgi:UDP-glucose 4-epimerase